jgi:hypothetical protein
MSIKEQENKVMEELDSLGLPPELSTGADSDENTSFLDQRLTYTELMEADIPDPDWFVPGFLPNPGLVAVTGRPGSFKTFFTQWLGLRLAAGKPLFDQWDIPPEKQGMDEPYKGGYPLGVLFMEEEMNERQLKQRSNLMKSWKVGECFQWLINSGFTVKDEKKVKELREFVEREAIKLIVLDPFTTVLGMEDENSNAEAREVMDILRKNFIDTEHGCTVIFIHHPSKSGSNDGSDASIRGAGDILGKCDMHFVLDRLEEKGETSACEE